MRSTGFFLVVILCSISPPSDPAARNCGQLTGEIQAPVLSVPIQNQINRNGANLSHGLTIPLPFESLGALAHIMKNIRENKKGRLATAFYLLLLHHWLHALWSRLCHRTAQSDRTLR